MEQHRTLKIMANTDNVVEFLYDSPKEGTNDYGIWHRYALNIMVKKWAYLPQMPFMLN